MRFNPKLFRSYLSCRTVLRACSSTATELPFVKVIKSEKDNNIRITLKNAHIPNLNLTAPKTENVRVLLSQIKLRAEVQRKFAISSIENDDIEVCLLHEDDPIDSSTPNSDAWASASALRIGGHVYQVNLNTPQVTTLTLPDYILPGCFIRPHVFFEGAELSDSEFVWFRSLRENEKVEDLADEIVVTEGGKTWVRVGEGYVYHVTSEDAECHLKVMCTPKLNCTSGFPCFAESPLPVESGTSKFPFEERQMCTRTFVEDDCIRCISYNILANMYVEKKKFPYASDKARDHFYRKQILIKELLGYKGDVICVQECQDRTFEIDLNPLLKQAGYTGFYRKKGGTRFEGLATFVRDSKYKVVKNYGILLNLFVNENQKHIFVDLIKKVSGYKKDVSKLVAQNTALQVLLLEHVNQPGNKLLVANTHLYSNKDNPEVRLLQTAICTYYIEHVIKRKELLDVPILFCGDFNSQPDSDAVHFMMTGKFECNSSWKKNSDSTGDTVLRHSLCLDSACGTPEYTNYTEEFHGCLDYIFYSKNSLKVKEVVPMPSHETVTAQVALPSELFPSDHIALVCTLQCKKS